MTAAAKNRSRKRAAWKFKEFTLAITFEAFKYARAAIDLGTGKVVPASADPNHLPIGWFAEAVDATAAAKAVTVELDREIEIEWLANDAGTAVVAADVGKLCFGLDDQTVTMDPANANATYRVWAVDATKGVAVQALEVFSPLASQPDAGAFAAGDYAPAEIVHGSINDVPMTAANSTLTLPAASADGTVAHFVADGTKNGHTVQYRDETGPANLTTALTASKRHMVTVSKLGGKWFANAYVSP